MTDAIRPQRRRKRLLPLGADEERSRPSDDSTRAAVADDVWSGRLDTVVHGGSVEITASLPESSVHLILSDIPYGIGAADWDVLHANTNSALLGASPAQIRAGRVFGRRGKPLNGWSAADRAIPRQYQDWCSTWAAEWLRVLKPGGSAVVFAGRRHSSRCVCALEDAGFSFKDMLAWMRKGAPHRAQRLSAVFGRRGNHDAAVEWAGWRVGNLRPRFEPVLWFVKPYRTGTSLADTILTHGVGAYDEDAFLGHQEFPDNVLSCGFAPGESGLHPTQKPVALMRSLVALTTRPGQVVMDPFCGSGSTLVAARSLERRFIGIEKDPIHVETSRRRLAETKSRAVLIPMPSDASGKDKRSSTRPAV